MSHNHKHVFLRQYYPPTTETVVSGQQVAKIRDGKIHLGTRFRIHGEDENFEVLRNSFALRGHMDDWLGKARSRIRHYWKELEHELDQLHGHVDAYLAAKLSPEDVQDMRVRVWEYILSDYMRHFEEVPWEKAYQQKWSVEKIFPLLPFGECISAVREYLRDNRTLTSSRPKFDGIERAMTQAENALNKVKSRYSRSHCDDGKDVSKHFLAFSVCAESAIETINAIWWQALRKVKLNRPFTPSECEAFAEAAFDARELLRKSKSAYDKFKHQAAQELGAFDATKICEKIDRLVHRDEQRHSGLFPLLDRVVDMCSDLENLRKVIRDGLPPPRGWERSC